ncbi:NAD(P)/FAD-dependent oxidoreductase [Actinocorallia longicatena]|uniref:FAD-dependent oxidoreductase n=1 Tax=Actinocorallia longicatena TaxID=111803 RepID=A0ABP6QD83_9ACTN
MRFAVVGSGVSGLTAAHLLRERGEVTLFEADDRLGGHAHTHDLDGQGVDSGFIVHNDRTYPHLTRLFRELEVATRDTEMSLSVSCAGCGLEYAGARGAAGLLARRRVSPRYARLLAQVPRFHRRARALLATGTDETTLREFLAAEDFTPYFVRHFVTPLVAAVWSCAPGTALDYPARHLFVFLANHGMLSITGSPRWRTVVGGSRTYVERVAAGLDSVRVSTPVTAIVRGDSGLEVRTPGGAETFDAAVVATHPAHALRMLADPTPAEEKILGAFTYTPNTAVLHGDASVLPRAAGARASWNYAMDACDTSADRVRVTYDMNRLQGLPGPGRYLVSLGADIAPDRVLARMEYEHPVFTREAVAAQALLPSLNGPALAFAGAYHGWGFHEDGCRSGVAAAAALGARW